MPRKEFSRLIEDNVTIVDRLIDRLKIYPDFSKHTRQQLSTLVRLYLGGRAKLKDIARREFITTSNLCATFRKLENDGLVLRTIDEEDRRNTWYSVTNSGEELAKVVIEKFRESVEIIFRGITREDEERLTGALKIMNELLRKMELINA